VTLGVKSYSLRMIGHGERLIQIRELNYDTVKLAVDAMNELGHEMSTNQFYALQRGQWPSKKQLAAICEFFNVQPECYLFGRCDAPDEYSHLMDGLSPNMKKLAESLVSTLVAQSQELNL